MTDRLLVENSLAFVGAFATQLTGGDAASGRWVQLIPAGTFRTRDGRGPFRTGAKAAMQAIVDASLRYAGSADIVIDYNHQTVFGAIEGVGGRAPAAGWIKELQVREDGIYGRVEWTDPAAAAIKAGEYRYLSPYFAHRRDGQVRLIVNAGLTNTPALDILPVAASALPGNLNGETTMDKIAKALGLPEGSGEDAILSAIAALMGGNKPDPAQYVPMATFQATAAELNKLRQGVTREAAERHVEQHVRSGQLAPFMRDWAVELCTVNMPAFDSFVGKVGKAFSAIVTPSNHLGARGPAGQSRASDLSELEQQVCSALGLSQEAFLKGQQTGTGVAKQCSSTRRI